MYILLSRKIYKFWFNSWRYYLHDKHVSQYSFTTHCQIYLKYILNKYEKKHNLHEEHGQKNYRYTVYSMMSLTYTPCKLKILSLSTDPHTSVYFTVTVSCFGAKRFISRIPSIPTVPKVWNGVAKFDLYSMRHIDKTSRYYLIYIWFHEAVSNFDIYSCTGLSSDNARLGIRTAVRQYYAHRDTWLIEYLIWL